MSQQQQQQQQQHHQRIQWHSRLKFSGHTSGGVALAKRIQDHSKKEVSINLGVITYRLRIKERSSRMQDLNNLNVNKIANEVF